MPEPNQSLGDRRYARDQQIQDDQQEAALERNVDLVDQFNLLNQSALEMFSCTLQIWARIAQTAASNLDGSGRRKMFRKDDYSRSA